MSLSKKLTGSYKERMEQSHNDMDITFNITVLSKNIWPIDPPKDDFIVPTDIELTYDRFQRYYQTKHSGRKLMWLWNYSDIELRANYSDQEYIFVTSAYQMAVLLQYNNNDRLTLDKLATAINLRKDLDFLAQVLQPLVKSRILISDEVDLYDFNPRASRSLIRLFVPFLSKIFRFQIKEDSRELESTSSDGAQCRVQCCREDGGRESQIRYPDDYCPVRIPLTLSFQPFFENSHVPPSIMKVRKTMEMQPLMQEVISLISQQFVPRIPDITKVCPHLFAAEV